MNTTENKAKGKNIILIDFPKKENWDFKNSLEEQTNLKWEEEESVSNQRRKNKLSNIIRYLKYFIFPLKIFLKRRNYQNIVAWQQFYGVLYAFYSRLFHSKKYNKLIIMTFIYKEKKGLIGKIYYKFVKYAIQNEYIDKFICFSKKECDYYSKKFNINPKKFEFCRLGIEEIPREILQTEEKEEKYIISAGRSNRDYDFLYEALKDTNYKVKILSDECNLKDTSNIKIYKNIFNEEYYKTLNKAYLVVVPLLDKNISSGQLVFLQAMQLGKPIICTESKTVEDYIKNGENGFIIKKDAKELINKIEELYNNKELYQKMSQNEKNIFEENFSSKSLGKQVAEILNK